MSQKRCEVKIRRFKKRFWRPQRKIRRFKKSESWTKKSGGFKKIQTSTKKNPEVQKVQKSTKKNLCSKKIYQDQKSNQKNLEVNLGIFLVVDSPNFLFWSSGYFWGPPDYLDRLLDFLELSDFSLWSSGFFKQTDCRIGTDCSVWIVWSFPTNRNSR